MCRYCNNAEKRTQVNSFYENFPKEEERPFEYCLIHSSDGRWFLHTEIVDLEENICITYENIEIHYCPMCGRKLGI